MDPLKLTKQMIDFNKASFDNTFNAMVLLQEQTEKMVNAFMEQATWLPGEGKKALNEWVETVKKGRSSSRYGNHNKICTNARRLLLAGGLKLDLNSASLDEVLSILTCVPKLRHLS